MTRPCNFHKVLKTSVGNVIIRKLAVKFEVNEILGVDNFDMFACYQDLCKTESEK